MKARGNSNAKVAVFLVTLAVAFLLFNGPALSQVTGGAIGGLLTDTSASVIPAVVVEATNLATNEKSFFHFE